MSLSSRIGPGQGVPATESTTRPATPAASRGLSDAEVQRRLRSDLPETAYLEARSEFYEAIGAPVVQRARLWILLVISLVLVGVLVLTIHSLVPLKTVQPWVVKVDGERGTVELDKSAAVKPSIGSIPRPVVERELNEWIRALWSINGDYPSLTKEQQEAAYVKTRDRATKAYLDFVKSERVYARIRQEPGLVRTVEPRTTTFRAEEGVAMVRFSTVERTRQNPEARRREWLMLLQYRLDPQTDPEEIQKNPLGLYVFHFEITEER